MQSSQPSPLTLYTSTVPVNAAIVIENYRPGDTHQGWANQLQHLWTHSRARLLHLIDEVVAAGEIHTPIEIGTDQTVREGHHRIAVALALNLPFKATISTREV